MFLRKKDTVILHSFKISVDVLLKKVYSSTEKCYQYDL